MDKQADVIENRPMHPCNPAVISCECGRNHDLRHDLKTGWVGLGNGVIQIRHAKERWAIWTS